MAENKGFWTTIIGGVGAMIGFVVYYITMQNKEVNKLQAQVELAETEHQTDLIEAEIKEIKNEKERLKKTEQEIQKVIESIDEKRKSIRKKANNMTDEEVVDYWNKS